MSEQTIQWHSVEVIAFLYRKRKIILALTLTAAVLSAIISFLITPKYKSSVIIFPATMTSVSKELLTEATGTQKNLLKFGEEEEAEQLLQVLYSDEIRDKIIQKYNLMKHYDIDSTAAYPKTSLYEEFSDNISFRKTEYFSVEIKVLDKNPKIAADIANDICDLVDTAMNRMLKERAVQALRIFERQYFDYIKSVRLLEDSLQKLQSYGIVDYENQSRSYTRGYADAILKNDARSTKIMEDKIAILSKFGTTYSSIQEFLINQSKQLSILKHKHTEAKLDANLDLSHKFIVNRATIAEKKSYPVRWLIVVLSTTSTFLLAIFLVIAIENLKQINFKQLDGK